MKQTYISSVYHLAYYKNQLEAEIKSLHTFISKFDNDSTRPPYLLLFSNTLLTTTKYLDEYNKFFNSSDPEVKPRIATDNT